MALGMLRSRYSHSVIAASSGFLSFERIKLQKWVNCYYPLYLSSEYPLKIKPISAFLLDHSIICLNVQRYRQKKDHTPIPLYTSVYKEKTAKNESILVKVESSWSKIAHPSGFKESSQFPAEG